MPSTTHTPTSYTDVYLRNIQLNRALATAEETILGLAEMVTKRPDYLPLEPSPRSGWGFMLGRYQPWHPGHQAMFVEVLKRHPAGVVIGIRNTYGTTAKDPLPADQVAARIQVSLEAAGYKNWVNFQIQHLPDIQGIYYGRDVGYAVEKIELPPEIQAISATKVRAEQGL